MPQHLGWWTWKASAERVKAGALFLPEPLCAQSSYLIVLEKCSNRIWETLRRWSFGLYFITGNQYKLAVISWFVLSSYQYVCVTVYWYVLALQQVCAGWLLRDEKYPADSQTLPALGCVHAWLMASRPTVQLWQGGCVCLGSKAAERTHPGV